MSGRARIGRPAATALAISLAVLVAVSFTAGGVGASTGADEGKAQLGEARTGAVSVAIAPAVADVAVAGPAGRPIVVIDPGHGGRDPGATSVSGNIAEKQLTLAMANELRSELLRRGRVRVALTRADDHYVVLEDRADIARRLNASLFLSLHMDSAPNPLARGASIYSLADVASDADAARFAVAENGRSQSGATHGPDTINGLLADLAVREQMTQSAGLAARLVVKARGKIGLRPEPHRFATFHVLRRSGVPAILFEAGYISNAEDEVLLADPKQRSRMVAALATAIEADIATRGR